MTTITPKQRRAVEEPARVLGPATNTTDLLTRVEDYARFVVAGLVPPPADPAALCPLIDEAFGRKGWDDLKMSEYDDDEFHRP